MAPHALIAGAENQTGGAGDRVAVPLPTRCRSDSSQSGRDRRPRGRRRLVVTSRLTGSSPSSDGRIDRAAGPQALVQR